MFVLIIIITAVISIVWTYSLNFLLSGNSFETENNLYLTGYDNDLEECWHLIRNRTDISGYPAEFSGFSLDRAADGEIESLILHYYVRKDEDWYTYQISYRENGDRPGGRFSVLSHETRPEVPGYTMKYSLDPAEFLNGVDMINLTSLGYEDNILSIDSDSMDGNLEYTCRAEDRIFLQDGDRLFPIETIVLREDYPAFAVFVSEMNCTYYDDISYCSSSETTAIFSKNRLKGAEIRLRNESSFCPEMV